MKKEVLYEFKALYRGDFRVIGYQFGEGEPAACVVGNLRGNENQQVFCCSQLIKRLKELEAGGKITPGKAILVIPSGNPYSLNTKTRFWGIDKTDINRMFPGYDQGETTQRIAEGIFRSVKDYRFGIQFCSFYMRGRFMPHVRMMQTGYENVELAKQFGLPYVVTRKPRPFDTTTLNYNWQIWETDAFSIYTSHTEQVDKISAGQAVEAILNFFARQEIIRYKNTGGYLSEVIDDSQLVTVRAEYGGFFDSKVIVGQHVKKDELLAEILDPYEAESLCKVYAPCDGTVLFARDEAMTYSKATLIKLAKREEL